MKRAYLIVAILTMIAMTFGCKKEEDVAVENPTNTEESGVMDENDTEVTLKIDTLTTVSGIQSVRTLEQNFQDLPDWPYAYQHVEIDGLRQAYAEADPADGPVVLLLHGQPNWSYLYRKMMPVLADAGYQAIAIDHLRPIRYEVYEHEKVLNEGMAELLSEKQNKKWLKYQKK